MLKEKVSLFVVLAASLFAVAALMVAAFAANTASAQPASPMVVYGLSGTGDVAEGDVINAYIDGEMVGTATADADGWSIAIQDGDAGALVTFSINGAPAAETIVYEAFGFAEAVLTEGVLTAPAPTPAKTGNAGMLGSKGTSMALVLALGVFAAALVAGFLTATRRS